MAEIDPSAPVKIREQLVSVAWVDEAFYCGSVLATGCAESGVVRVVCESCVADSALVHELLHVYLQGDPTHSSPLWASVRRINAKVRLMICR